MGRFLPEDLEDELRGHSPVDVVVAIVDVGSGNIHEATEGACSAVSEAYPDFSVVVIGPEKMLGARSSGYPKFPVEAKFPGEFVMACLEASSVAGAKYLIFVPSSAGTIAGEWTRSLLEKVIEKGFEYAVIKRPTAAFPTPIDFAVSSFGLPRIFYPFAIAWCTKSLLARKWLVEGMKHKDHKVFCWIATSPIMWRRKVAIVGLQAPKEQEFPSEEEGVLKAAFDFMETINKGALAEDKNGEQERDPSFAPKNLRDLSMAFKASMRSLDWETGKALSALWRAFHRGKNIGIDELVQVFRYVKRLKGKQIYSKALHALFCAWSAWVIKYSIDRKIRFEKALFEWRDALSRAGGESGGGREDHRDV